MTRIRNVFFLLLSFCFSLQVIGQVNLQQGLVAYYPFNGNANDESGNGYNATPENGTHLASDRFGNSNNAYSFDGIDDYINIITAFGFSQFENPQTSFTYCVWFKTNAEDFGTLFSNSSEDGWSYFGVDNKLKGVIRDDTWNGTTLSAITSVNDGYWHFASFLFLNPSMKLYIDGNIESSGTFIGELLSSGGWPSGGIKIGVQYLLDYYYYNGLIDDVRIYNRVLNDQEIQALYYENQPPQTNTISNILINPRSDDSGLVDVLFNLSGTSNLYSISLEASFNGGTTYIPIPGSFLNGDIGPIQPGNNKHIVWDGVGSFPNTFSTQAKLKIIAVNCLPILTTASITSITATSAISGGNVTNAGTTAVTAYGVCWNTIGNPTVADSKTLDGSGISTFTSTISGLTPNTTYYVRAYATNSFGTDYGNQLIFTTAIPAQCGDPFTDERDGKVYSTLQLGSQCWMKQNLNIGTRIAGASNQTDNGIVEKYCYDNTESNCDYYGGLYQWDEMMQYTTTAGVKGICPIGWHIPTDADWTTLTSFVRSQPAYRCNNTTSYIAKSLAATTNWNASTNTCGVGNNLAANNATGFTSLPGGYRHNEGPFIYFGLGGGFWSSTEISGTNAWNRNLAYASGSVFHENYYTKSYGFSVRCLKD